MLVTVGGTARLDLPGWVDVVLCSDVCRARYRWLLLRIRAKVEVHCCLAAAAKHDPTAP